MRRGGSHPPGADETACRHKTRERRLAPVSKTFWYHGRRRNVASLISVECVRSSRKTESMTAPTRWSKVTRFDSSLNASDRLSKFIVPTVLQTPSMTKVFRSEERRVGKECRS